MKFASWRVCTVNQHLFGKMCVYRLVCCCDGARKLSETFVNEKDIILFLKGSPGLILLKLETHHQTGIVHRYKIAENIL